MSIKLYVRFPFKSASKIEFSVTSDAVQPLCTNMSISDKDIYAQEDKGTRIAFFRFQTCLVRRTQLALAEMMKKYRMQQQALVN